MSASGPSASRLSGATGQKVDGAGIEVIDVNASVTHRLLVANTSRSFAGVFGEGRAVNSVIGAGDALDISIWEAPPATLFGSAISTSDLPQGLTSTAHATSFPAQIVERDGTITIPFAGSLSVAGLTPDELAKLITKKLDQKAHDPQVIVRFAQNATRNVTVIGDVSGSARVPLTSKGERLLDILAAVGGTRQPLSKTVVKITRGEVSVSMPLQQVIADPHENIILKPDDIVTAQSQPYSFVALGASSTSAEVPFEATGITLAQALGRVGGLQDTRADARGIFIFRLENPSALSAEQLMSAHQTPDGRVPIIYRVDMKDPTTFFTAQSFPIKDKDIIYVSNAPLADLQKFINIISSIAVPVVTIKTATQ